MINLKRLVYLLLFYYIILAANNLFFIELTVSIIVAILAFAVLFMLITVLEGSESDIKNLVEVEKRVSKINNIYTYLIVTIVIYASLSFSHTLIDNASDLTIINIVILSATLYINTVCNAILHFKIKQSKP